MYSTTPDEAKVSNSTQATLSGLTAGAVSRDDSVAEPLL